MLPGALPTSDCEAIATVGLAQRVNAVSSGAYLLFGLALVVTAARRTLRPPALLLGALVVAEGVGSAWFHGSPSAVGRWLHDVALFGVLGTIAGWHVGRIVHDRAEVGGDRGAWVGGVAVTVAGGVLHLVADVTNTVVGVLIVVAIVAEVVARRRGLPAGAGRGFVVLVVLAVVVYLLGRTDGPLCRPDSIVQLHGLWHVVTALAVFVWADRALATAGPDVGAGNVRAAADAVVGLLAVGLVRTFHRSVDVRGRHTIPRDRPELYVVNHGNGFVDPIVLAAALRRLPRFVAKAALWKVPPARWGLDALAVLPVYRSSDGDDPHGNERTFDATTRALARRHSVAIFPEGTTGDRAHLDRIRSGASRMALQARAAGVRDIVVVPVGLAFESRVATRSRASVRFGTPIDLDAWCAGRGTADDDERARVGALNDAIRDRLTDVSPVYASVDEREQLRLAADVTLRAERADGRAPRFGEVEHRASRIARAPDRDRERVVEAMAHHALRREMVGVGDAGLGPGHVLATGGRVALAVLAVVLLGPVLVTATVVHLPLLLLVLLGVSSVRETATKGTVRLLIGLVGLPLTWWLWAVATTDGAVNVAIAMAVLAVLAAVAISTWSTVARAIGVVVLRFRARDRRQLLDGLVTTRDAVVAAVHDAESSVFARPDVEAASPQGVEQLG